MEGAQLLNNFGIFKLEKCKLLIDVVIVGLVTLQIRIPHQQIALFDEFHPLLSKWLPT